MSATLFAFFTRHDHMFVIFRPNVYGFFVSASGSVARTLLLKQIVISFHCYLLVLLQVSLNLHKPRFCTTIDILSMSVELFFVRGISCVKSFFRWEFLWPGVSFARSFKKDKFLMSGVFGSSLSKENFIFIILIVLELEH